MTYVSVYVKPKPSEPESRSRIFLEKRTLDLLTFFRAVCHLVVRKKYTGTVCSALGGKRCIPVIIIVQRLSEGLRKEVFQALSRRLNRTQTQPTLSEAFPSLPEGFTPPGPHIIQLCIPSRVPPTHKKVTFYKRGRESVQVRQAQNTTNVCYVCNCA